MVRATKGGVTGGGSCPLSRTNRIEPGQEQAVSRLGIGIGTTIIKSARD